MFVSAFAGLNALFLGLIYVQKHLLIVVVLVDTDMHEEEKCRAHIGLGQKC